MPGLCTPGLPCSQHWMGSWSQAEDRIHTQGVPAGECCQGLFAPESWCGRWGGPGWVVVRQALAKDASSEQNFSPRKGWNSLEAEWAANEPVSQGGGAPGGIRGACSQKSFDQRGAGYGVVLAVDGTGTLPLLFCPLFPLLISLSPSFSPTSLLSHRRSSQLYTGTGPWRRRGVCGRGTGHQ